MKHLKQLSEAEENHSNNLKRGLDLFKGLPHDINLTNYDKYVFKYGDVNGEMAPDVFPFNLKKDSNFTLMDTKHNVKNFTVEIDGKYSYHIFYAEKDMVLEIVVAYNEKEKAVNSTLIMNEFLAAQIRRFNGDKDKKEAYLKKAEGQIDKIVNQVSIMIACLNEGYSLKHTYPRSFKRYTGKSFKNVGQVNLVTTRFKNMLFICDAYPLFFEIDWFKFNDETKKEEDAKDSDNTDK